LVRGGRRRKRTPSHNGHAMDAPRGHVRRGAPLANLEKRKPLQPSNNPSGTRLSPMSSVRSELGDGKERGIFAVTQQYTGSFNPARRFGSRPCNRHQLRHILITDRQLNPAPCRHDLRPLPRIKGQGTGQRNRSESHANDQFYGIDELGASAIESRFAAMRTAMTPLVLAAMRRSTYSFAAGNRPRAAIGKWS
jgi:hypothetical protein